MKWELARLTAQVRSVCEITPDGCWIWRHGSWAHRDYTTTREYPRLMLGGQRYHVARWVLIAVKGDSPGMEPCHSCDEPACVSPEHLRWDTHKANMQEMGTRRRAGRTRHPDRYHGRLGDPAEWARGEEHWMRREPERAARVMASRTHGFTTHPERWTRGEAIPWSKLTAAQIPGIRLRLAAGEQPAVIAPDYGVGRGTIRAIAQGRTWKHVA